MKNVVEFGQVQDTFCFGLARVEKLGASNFRLTFAVSSIPIDCDDSALENVVCAKLIIPAEALNHLRRAIETSEMHFGGNVVSLEPPNETLN